jgi:hypothetical protein
MEKELTPEQWKEGLKIMAENAVSIPKGEKRGRWTREMRVALVYSILCSLARKAGAPLSVDEK